MSAERRLLLQRRQGPELCLLCRERVVAERGASCLACGARYHKACLDSARCLNLGCGEDLDELAPATSIAQRSPAASSALLDSGWSLLLALGLALTLVGTLVWLIDLPRWPPQAVIAASLVVGAALVVKLASSDSI